MPYDETSELKKTAKDLSGGFVQGMLRGFGGAVGAGAVIAAVLYFYPGLADTVRTFLNSCFG